MSFLKGTFSAQRYTTPTRAFGEDEIEQLKAFGIDRTQAGEDGVQAGWSGGDHELDGDLSCGKNLRGEFLSFAFRVSQTKYPPSRVRAMYQIELKGVMDAAGAEWPTGEMKREAREAAQAKIEEEGKDGRYLKHTLVPVVWDGAAGQVWYGSASHTHAGRFLALFVQTFGVDITPVTSGMLVPGKDEDVALLEPLWGEPPVWCPEGYDWLGNEFALWVMWAHHTAGDPDSLSFAVTKRLLMACPDGRDGTDMFSHELPAHMPETFRALQFGKLPREVGLTLTDGSEFTTLTLDPELWVASGVKVPELEDVPPGQSRDVQRLEQVRAVFALLDALFGQFIETRLGDGWAGVAGQINDWIGRVPAVVS